jgi:formamidopyrimidine-DNA glycosylase
MEDGRMPEGDTVYALARRLDSALRDRVLTHGELRVPAHATADLAGLTVLEHLTHGKHLLTRLSNDLTLHTHLLMSGSWTVSDTGRWLPRAVMLDVRVVLRTDGPAAYGVKIPIVELLRTWDEGDVVGHLGPDPLRDDWDIAEATRRLSEDPDRPLVAALLELGARALRHSATVPGAMQVTTGTRRRGEQHWVTGRAGRPCLRCGTTVRVVAEVSNDPERRRTWWCPNCQSGPVGPPRGPKHSASINAEPQV